MNNLAFILSEIELRYNPSVPVDKRPHISCAEDAHKQLLILLNQTQLGIREECVVLYLNRHNRVMGGYKLSSGGMTGTVMDIRIILGIALKCLALGIIVAHTHPSGELSPSKRDLELTGRLNEAARLMDLRLVDHLIITISGYLSFAEEGLIVDPGS